jgi:DNA-binding CsgD family transcriptional regulator
MRFCVRGAERTKTFTAAGSAGGRIMLTCCGGLADKQIAARLHLSPRTVEKHVESLLRKTGARSRTGLVAAASQAAARDSQRAFPPSATT